MQLQRQRDRNATESNGQTNSNETIERLPTALDSSQTKLVYLYLATVESGTVEDVRDALGIELISLYPVLSTLTDKGLVRKDGSRYVCSDA